MNKMSKGVIGTASVLILLMAAFMTAYLPADGSDADPSGNADYTIYRYAIGFSSTSENVMYLVWDFADGTVLDGRWEHYLSLQESGQELSEEVEQGVAAYKTLLRENGNSIYAPVHTYAQKGIYTYSITAYNPIGYVSPTTGCTYDGAMFTDTDGYDAGLISGSSDTSVCGSKNTAYITIDVRGYPIITFDSRGGSEVSSVTVENGPANGGVRADDYYTRAAAPSDPERPGYTFAGWYTDEGCTTAYDWNATVTSDMTLYAGWTENAATTYTHTVHYNSNGGTGTMSDTVVTDDSDGYTEVALAVNTFARSGYAFSGWYTAAVGGSPASSVSVPADGSVTVYAHWSADSTSYKVTFVKDGKIIDTQDVSPGGKAAKLLGLYSYYSDEDCTQEYVFGAVDSDITVYVKEVSVVSGMSVSQILAIGFIIIGGVLAIALTRIHPVLGLLGVAVLTFGVCELAGFTCYLGGIS